MTRAEKVAVARELRSGGLLLREIAERMGVAVSTAGAYLTDPDLSKQNARREQYRGECVDCGAPTDGSGGYGKAPKRCEACSHLYEQETARWTAEEIVAAIRRFAERYGHSPFATDFEPVGARKRGHAARAERFYLDGDYPHVSTVRAVFGRWNAAIAAAGFEPQGPGGYFRLQARALRDQRVGVAA